MSTCSDTIFCEVIGWGEMDVIVWTKEECDHYRKSVEQAYRILPEGCFRENPTLERWLLEKHLLTLYRPSQMIPSLYMNDSLRDAFFRISSQFSLKNLLPVTMDRIRILIGERENVEELIGEMLRQNLLEHILVIY